MTEQLLFGLLFAILAFSSALTVVGSSFVIWRYRRSVTRAMSTSGPGLGQVELASAAPPGAVPPAHSRRSGVDADTLYRSAAAAPSLAAAGSAVAGLAYALVLACAYVLAFPAARTPTRFALTLWIDFWPVVVAAGFTAPRFVRWIATGTLVYFMPFVLGMIALILFPGPPPQTAEAALQAAFDTVTPRMMIVFWIVFAGMPTGVLLLLLNPRLRAVSPLLLAFSMLLALGLVAFWFGVYAAPIKGVILNPGEGLSRSADVARFAVLAVVGVAGAGLGAWLALGWVRKAYLAKLISDRSLTLDAFWVFFASYFAMQFAMQGQAWVFAGVLAFVAYRITLAAARSLARRRCPSVAPRGLTFLRVFSLGPKSNALFGALAMHWRWIGSLQLITGPDVAHSTVQPHQLLDYLSGRLAHHFIGDRVSLQARFAALDRAPDRDGWYRINNFFCRADAWQAVLAQLVREGDVVLMDLRSFSAGNAGCEHELHYLIEFVPLARCVLIVDRTTDIDYLHSTIEAAWTSVGTASPNRDSTPEAVELHVFDASPAAMRQLLRQLCSAALA